MVKPSNSNYGSPSSLEEQLRDAGRKVLHGTMSLILAASLVPVPSRVAFAEAGSTLSEQSTSEPDQEQGSTSTSQNTADATPSEAHSATEAPTQESSEQGSQESGSQASETPTEESGNNSSSQGEGQNTEESSATQQTTTQEQGSSSSSTGDKTNNEGQSSAKPVEQSSSNSQNSSTQSKEEPKQEESKGKPAVTTQKDSQETVDISASVSLTVPEGAKSVEKDGTTYCKSGAKVELTIDGVPEGAELILDEAKVNGGDEDLEKDASNKKVTLTLKKEGTYKDFTLTGIKVKEGDTTKSASDASASLSSNVTIDDTAPTPTIKIGDVSIDLDDLSAVDPLYLNAKDQSLIVTVADAIFDTDAEKSSVTVSGDSLTFAEQDNAYVATKETLAEGNLAFGVTTCDQLGNTKTTEVPEGSIVIDNTAPSGTYTIGSVELANNKTFEGGGVHVTLAGPDSEQSFNAENSYAEIKGEDSTETIPWSQYGDGTSSYFPIESEGTYTIKVHLEDKAGNKTDNTYDSVVVTQTAPKIVTISSDAGEGRSNLKDKTLATTSAEGDSKATIQVRVSKTNFPETGISLVVDGTAVADVAWADEGEEFKVASFEVSEAGLHKVNLAGSVTIGESEVSVDSHDVWTVDYDNTAPKIANVTDDGKLAVTGAQLEGTTSYRKQENGEPVTVTVEVAEPHFLAGDGGTAVTVTDGSGNEVDASKYTISWNPDDHSGSTHTATLGFPDDGTYQVTATAGKDALGNESKQEADTGSFTVDNTAPKITGEYVEDGILTVVGTKSARDDSLYKKQENGEPVTVTVEVAEPHFLAGDGGNGGTAVTVTDGSGNEVDASKYTISWNPDDHSGSTHTATLAFPDDGTYQVTATAGKDALGNASDQEVSTGSFTVDNTAPKITGEYVEDGILTVVGTKSARDDSLYKKQENGEPVTVTVEVAEPHFLAGDGGNGGTAVTVTDGSGDVVDPSTYTLAWYPADHKGSAHTATLAFPNDGTYQVTATAGKDALGNGSKQEATTGSFTVDNTAPTATLAWDGTTPEQKGLRGEEGAKTAYFDKQVKVISTINDANIDQDATTINGKSLATLTEKESVVIDGVTYTHSGDASSVDGLKVCMSYPEGSFAVPTVHAVDKVELSTDAESLFDDGIGTFVVDTTDPTALAYSASTPKNTTMLLDGESRGYYFFKTNEQGFVEVELFDANIDEKCIQVNSTDPYYASYAIAPVPSVPGKYRLTFPHLSEVNDFTDAIIVTVTDFAQRVTTWTMSANGIILSYDAGKGIDSKPSVLVEDDTAPVLAFSGFKNGKLDKYPTYVAEDQTITLTVKDRNLNLIHRLDSGRSLYTVTSPSGSTETPVGSNESQTQYVEQFEAKSDHSNDGHYKLDASLTDFVGLTGTASLEEFVIDTRNPVVDVAYDNNDVLHDEYYSNQRVATITVTETNFDGDLFTIFVAKPKECKQGTATPRPTSWKDIGDNKHQCTIAFVDDARYSFTISGQDKAGNQAVVNPYQEEFVIDKTAPAISTDYQSIGGYKTLLGDTRRFYPHAISITTTIKDRNLDTSTVRIWDPDGKEIAYGKAGWKVSGPDADGLYTYTHVMNVDETNGNRLTPRVDATDLAGNNSKLAPIPFVIDKTAPTINTVSVDQQPTSTGVYQSGGDPIQFFNKATKMTFAVSDIHQLRRVWIDDPDGEYTIAGNARVIAEGSTSAQVIVALRDGTQSINDTEFQRNIIFYVEDIAGNQRRWTLDRQGTLLKDEVVSRTSNVSINDAGVFPLALVQDTTAPYVQLSGATAGQYYNTPQTVRATVNEFNFGYLQQFAGSRSIMFVTKYEGNYTRAQSSWVISASQFQGGRPIYTYDQAFATDGHYVVRSQFADYANNESNVAEIGEFTIDRTAPVVTVTWDNYSAQNGNHYKASRTATITVVEHNFNPSDFKIDTTGVIGVWTTNGDTHVATVTYATDGTYSLTVSGKDMAGNVAATYSEPAFVIDTTMPKVTFKGTVQRYGAMEEGEVKDAYKGSIAEDGTSPEGRQGDAVGTIQAEVLQDHHAYNGEVSPIIVFRDDNAADGTVNYDPQGVSYTITDGGGHDVTKEFQALESRGGMTETGNGQEFGFGNLGLVTDENGPVVDENASTDGDTRYVYDPDMDGIYTIHASMTDLAGNKAENNITFSVNRYGSTYKVEVFDSVTDEPIKTTSDEDGFNYHILSNVPRILVTEVNVSGSDSQKDHQVRKEYANASKNIVAMSEAEAKKEAERKSDALGEGVRPAGYMVESGNDSIEATEFGWSEYHYTIREGNFGIGSDSENQDRGQGDYRVNVYSLDRATNDIGTDNYLDTEAYAKESSAALKRVPTALSKQDSIDASRRNAQVAFTLDEIGPAIEDINVPAFFALGTSYEASFYVNDVITDGDNVRIELDGRVLQEGEYTAPDTPDGTGLYKFMINASYMPFVTHDVKIVVSDAHDGYVGHGEVVESRGKFIVSTMLPEIAVVALAIGGVIAGVLYFRKRKSLSDSTTPGRYE